MKTSLISTLLIGVFILLNPKSAYSKPYTVQSLDSVIIAQVQETANLPDVIVQGLELYKQGNVEAAVNEWIDSMSAFINEAPIDFAQKQQQMKLLNQARPVYAAMLTALSKQYGACRSYSIIKSITRNQFTRSIYLEIQQEKGSIYMMFITLKTENAWRIVETHVNQNFEELLRTNSN